MCLNFCIYPHVCHVCVYADICLCLCMYMVLRVVYLCEQYVGVRCAMSVPVCAMPMTLSDFVCECVKGRRKAKMVFVTWSKSPTESRVELAQPSVGSLLILLSSEIQVTN